MKRRTFLAGFVTGTMTAGFGSVSLSQASARRLEMPPLLDATTSGRFRLEAQTGRSVFTGSSPTGTWGFNQPFLGPTLRLATGRVTAAEVRNSLDEPISVHWHGLLVPGEVDGGPHQTIAPADTWFPELPIGQPAATAWYHSHAQGATARQVQMGLAGVLQVSDGQDDARGLPSRYGVDDLTLVLQDRRFTGQGAIDLSLSMPDRMMGFLGDTILVNGQVGVTAVVPKGLVRLRLVNGSNARIYDLAFSDNRPMHLVATDGGYLDRPIQLSNLRLSPGERVELLVDFATGSDVVLTSGQNPNVGMMGGMMGGRRAQGGRFSVLPFSTDSSAPARITKLPTDLGGGRPDDDATGAPMRRLSLDMPMGMGMMRGGAGGQFSINGAAFAMNKINFGIERGTMERWTVSAAMMMHPFHIHGVRFQVLAENGHAPQPPNTGWKDTVLVNGSVDLLARFDHPAPVQAPYLYHCHILEHEDAGMMGQFTVD